MTKLVLIRHGMTEWNRQGRYCGRKDISLSRQGKIQVRNLGKMLKTIEFDRIYCSDRKRALQTSRIIFNGRKIYKLKELREINFGILEGLTHDEIIKKHGNIYKKWLKDCYEYNIPKAEPMIIFKKRIV